jgi:hypothetical protein
MTASRLVRFPPSPNGGGLENLIGHSSEFAIFRLNFAHHAIALESLSSRVVLVPF